MLAIVGATLTAGAQPARAQSNPYSPTTECNRAYGGGFVIIDQANLAAQGASGIVYLLDNGSRMCAITIKTANVGIATPTTVRLQRYLGTLYTDNDSYAYFAGPIYTYARVVGVQWGGSVSDNSGLGSHVDSYLSPCEHGSCTRGAVIANKAWYEYETDSRNNEVPMGSNCNYYTGYFGLGTDCAQPGFRAHEWCADFAKYVWKYSGTGVNYTDELTSSSLSFRTYGKNRSPDTWHAGTSGLAVGDAVVYDDGDGTGHVGIVVDVNSPAGDSWVISGNYSNKITRHHLSDRSNYAGYTEPVY